MSTAVKRPRRASSLRTSLRASTYDGICNAVMVGFGESYFPAFALFLGASAFEAGVLATLPILVGSLFQLAVPHITNRTGDRAWVIALVSVQALSLAPILWRGGDNTFAWLLGWACVYWVAGLGVNPAWNSWMGRMIPERLRRRYFSRRAVPVQVTLLVALVLAGFTVDAAKRSSHGALVGFLGIFAVAMVARLAGAYCQTWQSAPPTRASLEPAHLVNVIRGLVVEPYGRLIRLVCLIYFAVFFSAAYFTPYMLNKLGMSYAEFTVLNGAVIVARIFASSYWGKVAGLFGNRRTLQVAGLLMVPLPALWLISDHVGYLLVLQLIAGVVWAGFDLAVVLSFFDCTTNENRSRVLAVYNAANGVAMIAGTLAGGVFFLHLGGAAYLYVFLGSSLLRLAAVTFFARGAGVRLPNEHTFQDVFVRVVTFRPGNGESMRPIILRTTRNRRDSVAPAASDHPVKRDR
ncbi:MAG: MFS transporter [Myxococcales bacterium]|nr:MFS transporter [Myxococcales bacterium]